MCPAECDTVSQAARAAGGSLVAKVGDRGAAAQAQPLAHLHHRLVRSERAHLPGMYSTMRPFGSLK